MSNRGNLDDDERQRLMRLALADWSEAANARIDSVIVSTTQAAVSLFANGDYEYCVFFQADEHGQWNEAGSSSGHVDQAHLDVQAESARPAKLAGHAGPCP